VLRKASDRGRFVKVKTRLTIKERRKVQKKKKITYILLKASCLKTRQIRLAFF
jgi:hypothetical protein